MTAEENARPVRVGDPGTSVRTVSGRPPRGEEKTDRQIEKKIEETANGPCLTSKYNRGKKKRKSRTA